MKKERGWKELLKNNLFSIILVVGLISLGAVFAGNVIVKEGAVDVSNNLNVSGNGYVNGNLTTAGDISGAYLKSSSLTSERIPYVTIGGKLTDTSKFTLSDDGAHGTFIIGNNQIYNDANNLALQSAGNNSQIYLYTHNSAGTLMTYTFNPDGIFITPGSFRAYKSGSDSVASGPHTYLANADNTRAWVTAQLTSNNHIDMWYYDGSTWTRFHRFYNTGDIDFSGNVNIIKNITIGSLLKLSPIILPQYDSSLDGSLGRNLTGIYYCNSTTWRQISFVN